MQQPTCPMGIHGGQAGSLLLLPLVLQVGEA